MVKNVSFTKYEQEIRPKFRQDINSAESTEDVKKFFAYSVKSLFDRAFEGRLPLDFDDVALNPDLEAGFRVSERLRGELDFTQAWKNSDLPNILKRMAEPAIKRYRRLEKNPSKTEMKLFHVSH